MPKHAQEDFDSVFAPHQEMLTWLRIRTDLVPGYETGDYADGFDWLLELLKTTEFTRLVAIWNRRTKQTWDTLVILGQPYPSEYTMLQTRATAFRALWRKRPKILRHRSRKDDDGTTCPETEICETTGRQDS